MVQTAESYNPRAFNVQYGYGLGWSFPMVRLSRPVLRFDFEDVVAALRRHGGATDAR